MNQEIDFEEILNRYRSDPYSYVEIITPHTGKVRFHVEEGQEVEAVSGDYKHIPGTLLYVINRERNNKPIHSPMKGTISSVKQKLDGYFVEAGETIMTIRHPLKKKEIIEKILRKVLQPINAPERAKYFFSMDLQSKIDRYGQREVTINPGDEILTMSLMKREKPVFYEGAPGIIHSVYFQPGVSVNQGEPLIGICGENDLPFIQKIITRVKAEWE